MNISELMYDLEECKLEVESVLWEIVCDKRGVESVEEVFMWLYDLSNE